MEKALDSHHVSRLKTELPLNLFILDLGGGLRNTGAEQVTEDDILSRPFRALLRGFHHPGVVWAGQVAPDLKGFISVFANTMYDTAKSERAWGEELRHRHRVLPQFQLPHRLPLWHRRRLHLRRKKRQLHQLPVQGRRRQHRPPRAPGPPGQTDPRRPGLQGPDQRRPGPGPPGQALPPGNRADPGTGGALDRLLPPTRPGPDL